MGNTVHPIQPAPSQQATTSGHDEFRRLFTPYNSANNSNLVHQPRSAVNVILGGKNVLLSHTIYMDTIFFVWQMPQVAC